MRWVSLSASTASKRHSSTLVACSEKSAKFTPFPSHVAPSGYGFPGHKRIVWSPEMAVIWTNKAEYITCLLGRRAHVQVVYQAANTKGPGVPVYRRDVVRSILTFSVRHR